MPPPSTTPPTSRRPASQRPAAAACCSTARPPGGRGRTYNEIDIRWLLDPAADSPPETTAETGTGSGTAYRLYHQALIDQLRDQDPTGGGPVEEGAYELLLDSVPHAPQGV